MNDQQRKLQHRINAAVAAQIPKRAWDSTVAIVIAHNETVRLFGSGLLFRVADESFLLTAGHVVKTACQHGKTLAISSSIDSFVAVPGQWVCSANNQHGVNEGFFDIALHKLPHHATAKLGQMMFLNLGDVAFDGETADSVYAILGYPGLWSIPSSNISERVQLKPFQYGTIAFEGPTDCLAEYKERYNLLLDAQLKYSTMDDGSPAAFKDLEGNDGDFPGGLGGMSGCSVWRLGSLSVPIEKWNEWEPRVVGVLTGAFPQVRAIKATRWIAVNTLIHEAFPQLRSALRHW